MFHVKHKFTKLSQLRHFVAATICYVDRVSSIKPQASRCVNLVNLEKNLFVQ